MDNISLVPKVKKNLELTSRSLQCYYTIIKLVNGILKGMFCRPSCGINQIFFVHQDKFYVEIKKKAIVNTLWS